MHKTLKWCLVFGTALLLAAAMVTGCAGAGKTGDGKVKLSFQIWDTAQRNGMESVARAYMEQNPDVVIDVQVTSWDEYWTKLDAAAESNQLPDIFWQAQPLLRVQFPHFLRVQEILPAKQFIVTDLGKPPDIRQVIF